jgi:hypothetical protein
MRASDEKTVRREEQQRFPKQQEKPVLEVPAGNFQDP